MEIAFIAQTWMWVRLRAFVGGRHVTRWRQNAHFGGFDSTPVALTVHPSLFSIPFYNAAWES
jgi:hypothetical protein